MIRKSIIPAVLSLSLGTALAAPQSLQDADTNGDGNISLDEFKAVHAARVEEHFARLDQNSDGVLSAEELDRPRQRLQRPPGDRRPEGRRGPQAMIERLDVDGTGGLSQAELAGHRMPPSEEQFLAADTDGNGEIDASELANLRPHDRR